MPAVGRVLLGLIVTGTGLIALPALAAERTISVAGDTWTPAAVEIEVGDTVTWKSPTGFHDLVFADGAQGHDTPGSGWTFSRRFDAAGTVRFRCTVHSEGFTDGMSGAVTVHAAASPYVAPGSTPQPTSTPSATPTPSLIESLRIRVRRRVATATIRLTHAARVTGSLSRSPLAGGRYRKVGAIRAEELPAGTSRFVVRRSSSKRLPRGRYRVRLSTGADGLTLDFRVK